MSKRGPARLGMAILLKFFQGKGRSLQRSLEVLLIGGGPVGCAAGDTSHTMGRLERGGARD